MTMAQVNPDLWGLGEIPTVTSFFKLSLLDGKPKAGYTQLSSEKCGLGWVYLFQATNGNVTQRLASGAETAKRTIFHVSLATHTIATTEIGEITVSVKADNVTELTHYSSSILIPNSRPVPLASIISLSNFTGDISIQVQIELPSTFELVGSLGDKRSGTTLNIALAHSLLGKDLGDLRLACFNRRDGTVGGKEPKILFVNRSLLVGHSEYFDAVLSGAHPSCEIISPGSLKSLLYNDYEYFCDSDLESECDPDDCEGDATETQSKNSFPCQRDSILDDHEDIIFYGNAAYTTLKAFAFYLYTNEIRFKCLSSCKVSQYNAETGITSCSPKSMYRFAAQAGLEQLKELSLRAIIADISKDNVIEELFSPFTSMYIEVQSAEISVLLPLLQETDVMQNVHEKIADAIRGGMSRCSLTINSLIRHLFELSLKDRPCTNCLSFDVGTPQDDIPSEGEKLTWNRAEDEDIDVGSDILKKRKYFGKKKTKPSYT